MNTDKSYVKINSYKNTKAYIDRMNKEKQARIQKVMDEANKQIKIRNEIRDLELKFDMKIDEDTYEKEEDKVKQMLADKVEAADKIREEAIKKQYIKDRKAWVKRRFRDRYMNISSKYKTNILSVNTNNFMKVLTEKKDIQSAIEYIEDKLSKEFDSLRNS